MEIITAWGVFVFTLALSFYLIRRCIHHFKNAGQSAASHRGVAIGSLLSLVSLFPILAFWKSVVDFAGWPTESWNYAIYFFFFGGLFAFMAVVATVGVVSIGNENDDQPSAGTVSEQENLTSGPVEAYPTQQAVSPEKVFPAVPRSESPYAIVAVVSIFGVVMATASLVRGTLFSGWVAFGSLVSIPSYILLPFIFFRLHHSECQASSRSSKRILSLLLACLIFQSLILLSIASVIREGLDVLIGPPLMVTLIAAITWWQATKRLKKRLRYEETASF